MLIYWVLLHPTLCLSTWLPVLKVKVLSAHDKGSHAEVEVKVQKVLSQNTKMKIQRGRVTLYPESWTTRGCTCPILNPGQIHTHWTKIISPLGCNQCLKILFNETEKYPVMTHICSIHSIPEIYLLFVTYVDLSLVFVQGFCIKKVIQCLNRKLPWAFC